MRETPLEWRKRMSPLINWEELMELTRPPMPPRPAGEGNMWDNSADMYNQMAKNGKRPTL